MLITEMGSNRPANRINHFGIPELLVIDKGRKAESGETTSIEGLYVCTTGQKRPAEGHEISTEVPYLPDCPAYLNRT